MTRTTRVDLAGGMNTHTQKEVSPGEKQLTIECYIFLNIFLSIVKYLIYLIHICFCLLCFINVLHSMHIMHKPNMLYVASICRVI